MAKSGERATVAFAAENYFRSTAQAQLTPGGKLRMAGLGEMLTYSHSVIDIQADA